MDADALRTDESKPAKRMRTLVGISMVLIALTAHGQTRLEVEDGFMWLRHDTEELQYYKAFRSNTLTSWSDSRMPEFLGNSREIRLLMLISINAIDSTNYFFRVEESRSLDSFDPQNHGPIPAIRYTPKYPTELRRDEIEGEVTVVFVIGTDGSVDNLEIESSTDDRFNSEVLNIVQFWKFLPYTVNGEKMAVRVRQSIPFRIK